MLETASVPGKVKPRPPPGVLDFIDQMTRFGTNYKSCFIVEMYLKETNIRKLELVLDAWIQYLECMLNKISFCALLMHSMQAMEIYLTADLMFTA